jgi:tRNA (adenine22-N1)-methyltransferase
VTVPLPVRLRAAVSLVPPEAASVADVGAGHGAVAAHLALRGRARVIATELSAGALAELRANLAVWQLTDRVEVRAGPGLSPLAFGEAEVVVVAGVGARTALQIAAQAPELGVRKMVLQCMQRDLLVEPWLAARGWGVLASDMCLQRGRPYVTRLVEVGS